MHIAIAITLLCAGILAPLGLPRDLWKTSRIRQDIVVLMIVAIVVWFSSAALWVLQHD